MKRLPQIVLIVTFIGFSWLAMQAVHELGHVGGGLATGGRIAKVVLQPLTISQTDMGLNPHPLIEVWSGAVVGAILPLVIFLIAATLRCPGLYLFRFIRGMKDAMGMFTFRDGEPDVTEIRVFAAVAWLALMSDHWPDVMETSALVAGESPSPADVMAARVAIRKLCVRDVLRFTNGAHKRWNGTLGLSIRTVKILGLLTRDGPIFSEKVLLFERGVAAYGGVVGEGDGEADADVEPDPAKGSAAAYIPPADVIRTRIRETVMVGEFGQGLGGGNANANRQPGPLPDPLPDRLPQLFHFGRFHAG